MSETLKTSGEKSQENTEASRLKVLTKMSDKFDPEKARSLAEKDEAKKPETTISTHPEVPSTKPEKKSVEELTPKEASREYLDLLMDLSSNFTSAEGKSSRVASYDKHGNIQIQHRGYSGEDRRIVGQIYETATGKKFRSEREKFSDGKWEDKYVDRELALGMADDIISAESDWRAVGESTTIEAEQAERAALEQERSKARSKLNKIEHGIFGKIKKASYVNLRNKEYNRLYNLANHQPQTQAEQNTSKANTRLQKALEAAYSEDYGYGHHRLSDEHASRDRNYSDEINSEYNDKFFNKTRKEKIDRAVELRRKLEAEKIIKP